jgi:hypothetical protein
MAYQSPLGEFANPSMETVEKINLGQAVNREVQATTPWVNERTVQVPYRTDAPPIAPLIPLDEEGAKRLLMRRWALEVLRRKSQEAPRVTNPGVGV